MATTPLLYLNQYFTTFLNVGGGIDNSQTTGIVVQSVSGIDITKPGIACITYSSPIDTSVAEWVPYTSINGSNELQGVTRGGEGFSAKSHSNQAVVAFPLSESHINNLNAMFDSTGADFAQIATPASPSAGRNKLYFKSDGKLYTLTSAGVETAIPTTFVPPRTNTVTSHATPSINTDACDIFTITALAAAITSFTTNLSGTPVNGQKLIIRIKDSGTARAITWGASFASRGATLPTTTTLGKYHYIGFIYNSTASVWDCVAAVVEA